MSRFLDSSGTIFHDTPGTGHWTGHIPGNVTSFIYFLYFSEHYEVDEYGNFKLYFFSTSSLYERWRDDEFDGKCQDSAHWWKFVKSFWDNHFDKHANAESKESAHRKASIIISIINI
jgi:hypothetical protein